MNKYKISCPCHFGLESVLSFEAKKIGAENVAADNGRVTFEGDLSMIARANICLSTAERVLIELAEFRALSFEDLFQGVRKIPFEELSGYSLYGEFDSQKQPVEGKWDITFRLDD